MTYQEKQVQRLYQQYEELGDNEKQQILDRIRHDNIIQATKEVSKTRTVTFGSLLNAVKERQRYFNKFEGFHTGLRYFDDATMGLRPGELIIIAAPSNYGKTMIALNIAASAAVAERKKILIISMEMTAVEIASRLYNMVDDHTALAENIIIQTELRVNSKHIAAMIQRHKPDIVLVDHIQFLANQEGGGKEYERVNAAVANLKSLALEFNIPLISISHVAKTRSGDGGRATASDLKGSSSIEQDCDVGFMINRYVGQETTENIVVTLFKHRTKSPRVFHKDCELKFDGVRLAQNGEYYHQGMQINPFDIRQTVGRIWNA